MNNFAFFADITKVFLRLLVVPFLLFAASCASPAKSRYFDQSIPGQYPLVNANLDPIIQKADILSIVVSSLNEEASKVYNAPISTPVGYKANGVYTPVGYLVDPDGLITFPVLGKVQAEGLTKKQLTDSIAHSLVDRKLLVDPVVSIRILNFRVTVLGDVGKPSVVSVENEKISLLEAIGMAGDLNITAKRENVLLIREENEKKITRRINLNDESIFKSPYYYLKNNDIIYVEANYAKVQSQSRLTALLPSILSGLALIAIIFDRTR
nr:polysaccharide biosynthesis/export family protein [Flavihumibacter fluvii]